MNRHARRSGRQHLAMTLAVVVGLVGAARTLPAQQIPLRAGLKLEYAHKNFTKDRESQLLVEVLSRGADEAVLQSRWLDSAARATPMEERVSRREMLGARTLSYGRQAPVDTIDRRPRTIAMASQRMLRALRSSGTADASVPMIMGPTSIIVDGTFRLVSPRPDTLELIVEGAPRRLVTLHARGEFVNVVQGIRVQGDWWFLDDTTDAWMVKNESTIEQGRTFKMVLASAGSAATEERRVEDQLDKACRASVYGFYFASGSAALQPASAETFRTVAGVLRKHPDWTLTVEGHTDSIGGAAFNKQLSERRAGAVVRELTSKHAVAASRLQPAGLGLSRPAAPNGTLEGRARNRRVELVRPCNGRS
jgi:outer membrane protein OmpA-like peptidoglycan-associated protein